MWASLQGQTAAPAKSLCKPEDMEAQIKARIEEDAYNKGFLEGLRRSKMLQEQNEKEKEEESTEEEETTQKKHNRTYGQGLDSLSTLSPKFFRWSWKYIAMALLVVTFCIVSFFIYSSAPYGEAGGVSTGHSALGQSSSDAPVWCSVPQPRAFPLTALPLTPRHHGSYPESGSVSGVFLASFQPAASKNPVYGFNASQAPQACELMNVVIATKNQVEEAHRNGFGWIAEKIAVLPRIIKSKKCGQDRVGVITWNSIPTRLFDAFCFNVSVATTAGAQQTDPVMSFLTEISILVKEREKEKGGQDRGNMWDSLMGP
ncbi:hypothetical protein JZ751_014042 [Albula glossodonta]|uniref:Link domain-containing protein n=1 Tax=Albula glossodonta TaxID=121402 RepID=A0A8T2MJ78_9TELE|nr:hypothetical protein JZ751_014042 [Albula glossodonta]